ncbi:hypothetical protein GSI_10353 [Ganoderma sinense ZZ0214-1]|uniref:DUF6534 domain-containing protein n=1 Tax=Ganoderma sinense ZZ0214-1 TaxID=1077348 RepID=A0A2G8S0B3_9APHY|nr:hypothetical protein GSI_10353 [Ganoderma sinense ZZ0214-1]
MSDVQDQPPLPASLLLQIGPPFIGDLLAWMLFGISIVQLYIYHTSFYRDHIAIRAAVYFIFLLEVFQSIIVAVGGWQVVVAGWGRLNNLEYPGWSFPATPIVSVIISVSVQTFYAWRIWRLGGWRLVPLAIITTGLTSAAGAFAFSILFAFKKNIETFHETIMYSLTTVWLGVGAFTDILIMTSMFYFLYTAKQRVQHFESSELIVNKLMRLTVETGLACALTALIELALFLGLPKTNVHIIFATSLSKVYSNTFMTSLNSRASRYKQKSSGAINLGSYSGTTITDQLSSGSNPPLAIHITQRTDKGQNWDMELNDLPSSGSEQHTVTVSGKRSDVGSF